MVLGYLITFHTYGTWLHGSEKGSVDDDHNIPGEPYVPIDPDRHSREESELKYSPIELDAERRFIVDEAIREVCEYRHWGLRALNPRTTHVHIVVSSSSTPERVMKDFKGYSTRWMREAGILGKAVEPWSYHGSTRYLNTINSFNRGIEYVLHQQGVLLPMKCPAGWTPRSSLRLFRDQNSPEAQENLDTQNEPRT